MQSETKPEGGVASVGVATWNTVVHLCTINSPHLRTQVFYVVCQHFNMSTKVLHTARQEHPCHVVWRADWLVENSTQSKFM